MNDENQSIAANLPVGFDEKPIGNKQKFDIPEYAENEGPAMNVETQKLPLSKRLRSGALKNKKEAVEELLLLVKDDPKELKQYEEVLPEILTFNNASVVDKSLKILSIYLSSGQGLSIDPKVIIKIILEKCLATDKAEKQDIKKSCEQVLFWFMDNKNQEVLLAELNDGLLNKNPKIIGTSLLFIANLLNHYGVKRMKGLERFSKNIEILSMPAKPLAKPQTIQFFKELYRWVGDNLFRDFKIHHELKDEVTRFAKDYEKVPMEIKRGVKKQGNVEKKQMFSMDTEENENQEEVDVLANFTSKWVDQVLAIIKWKEKKEGLDEFIKKTRVSNILPPREIGHFITLIKRLLSDNNINLLLCGFTITQNLAKGLKRHFSNVAKNVVSNIYAKLKDAKNQIVEAAQETLKSLLHSVSLEDLLEEIKAGLDDKSSTMRFQSLKFLSNFVSKRQPKIMNVLRGLVEKIGKLTEDGTETVRKEALEFLCALKKVHGMKYFGDKLKNLDPKKLTVIRNAVPSQGQEMVEIESHTQVSHNTSMRENMKHQPTSKMQLEERMDQKEYSKETERIIVKNTKIKPEEPSVLSSVQNKPMKTVASKVINDLISTNQSVRYNAYQEIINKTNYADLKPLMYSIKSNGIKESSPNVLKLVLQIVKKYAGLDPIDMETLEYVYKHDWRKAKFLLQDFHSNNKFTPEASDFIRHNNITLSNNKSNPSVPPAATQTINLKGFMRELEFLLPSMTNPLPQIRIQAAQHLIKFLEPFTAYSNENELTPTNGWNQEVMTKFGGLIRFRLNEGDEVAGVYSELLKLLIHKGLLTRNKGIKPIMQTVIQKLKEKRPFIKEIFQEIATTNPQFLFSIIVSQLLAKQINEQLIQFILENNQLFIRNADHRAYICPFVHLIFNSNMAANLKSRLEKILDQIVELNGQGVLEAQVKKMKVDSIELEQYLAKYNVSHGSHFSKNMNLKNDRLKLDEENPWPIFAAPTHVLKLINLLISLKEPLPLLATPFHLTSNIIERIMELQDPFLADHSDLLLKWVYWRTVIEPSETIFKLMNFTYKIVVAVGVYISEIEYTVLLSSMINVMERFKEAYINPIGEILRVTFEFGYMQRSLLFWVNLFTSRERIINRIPVGEILQLITSLYSTEALTHQLPTLARSPQVLKNQFFLRFLSRNFDNQFLTATGFRVIGQKHQAKGTAEPKPLLSDMGGPENTINITPEEKHYYVALFQKCSSLQVQNHIKSLNISTQPRGLMDMHMKIIYSVVVPYIKKEIPVINVFSYFRELARLFSCDGLSYKHCLKDLTRLLMYFLIDLDENPVENKDEITKVINRIILLVLEKSQSRHMLEVLIILLQYQLKQNVNTKIQHLIYKCIGKVVKHKKFQEKWQENLLYLVTETDALFRHYDLKQDHPLMRTIRSIWKTQIISNHSYFTFLDHHFNEQTQTIHPTLLQIFTEAATKETLSEQPRVKEKPDYNPIKGITSSVNKLVALKKNEL